MSRKLRPIHPGEVLRLDFLDPLGISQYRLSRVWFGHCPIPFSVASILHNGDVLMCVHDWGRKEIVGNVRDNTLAEVWNGDRMREIRSLVSQRRYDEVAACRNCGLVKEGWF
ncbi:MAG TPA: SPASM domain-containing protein [Gemmatimonadaceae bacterium]|nr:SPASM domain-containing protein [Gemmatimonadaceae bacterium]